jgi:hypothetical protein
VIPLADGKEWDAATARGLVQVFHKWSVKRALGAVHKCMITERRKTNIHLHKLFIFSTLKILIRFAADLNTGTVGHLKAFRQLRQGGSAVRSDTERSRRGNRLHFQR